MSATVQLGLGIGEKPQQMEMLAEFKDLGYKVPLVDVHKARAKAKPIRGQRAFSAGLRKDPTGPEGG